MQLLNDFNAMKVKLWVVRYDIMLNSRQAVRMITRYGPAVVLAL